MKHLMLAVAALLVADAAFADTSTPAATETIAPPDCKKPPIMNKIRKADSDDDFNEAAEAYKTCITAYVSTQNDLARKHTEAANAAVDSFNAFLKQVDEKKSLPN